MTPAPSSSPPINATMRGKLWCCRGCNIILCFSSMSRHSRPPGSRSGRKGFFSSQQLSVSDSAVGTWGRRARRDEAKRSWLGSWIDLVPNWSQARTLRLGESGGGGEKFGCFLDEHLGPFVRPVCACVQVCVPDPFRTSKVFVPSLSLLGLSTITF